MTIGDEMAHVFPNLRYILTAMTEYDEMAMRLIKDAAQSVGYQPRDIDKQVAGIIVSPQVCRLLEAVHVRLVELLERQADELTEQLTGFAPVRDPDALSDD